MMFTNFNKPKAKTKLNLKAEVAKWSRAVVNILGVTIIRIETGKNGGGDRSNEPTQVVSCLGQR